MEQPFEISILIPVYNHKEYLTQSLESALNQTNCHVILLNDGSSENIEELLVDYSSNTNFELISQENKGLPQALSRLYLLAKAKSNNPFITWHSADNTFSPNAITVMSSFLVNNPSIGFVYSPMRIIDENGEVLVNHQYRPNDTDQNGVVRPHYPPETINQYNDNFIGACFLSRKRIEKLLPEFDPEALGFEDYKRWIQYSFIADSGYCDSNEPLYSYRIHKDSLSTQLGSENLSLKQKDMLRKSKKYSTMLRFPRELEIESKNSIFGIHKRERPLHQQLESLDTSDSELRLSYSGSEIFIAPSKTFKHSTHLEYAYKPCIISMQNTFLPHETTFHFALKNHLHLYRAQKRDLCMFRKDEEYVCKVLLFIPDIADNSLEQQISDLIVQDPHIAWVLYCKNHSQREIADNIFKSSKLSTNVRIADALSEDPSQHIQEQTLLNALGSTDIVISLTCFEDQLSKDYTHYLDSHIESCLAAASGRKILLPSTIFNVDILDIEPSIHHVYCSDDILVTLRNKSEWDSKTDHFHKGIDQVCKSRNIHQYYRTIAGVLLAQAL